MYLLNSISQADQLAAGFVTLKLERGDRIGMWGPNSYEWALTQWAAARAGLVLVLLIESLCFDFKII